MTIQEQRRKAFEDTCRVTQGWKHFDRYTGTDEYVDFDKQERWEAWNEALDSVEVSLPKVRDDDLVELIAEVTQAIESAGVRVKG
ncbi:hypothetical protein [Pseudomonas tohonis]|uniref:hypothetical protein n=1 Tax=Pseudomonas tohonis TaxID=2725477 RepID=UPI001F39C514|nr:hypothetical protein [Pseudomonas tohonis]